jgi:glycosyltransferase involved in cell wall biosynthesis
MKELSVYLSVTNDMVSDQRVNRMATTLAEEGYKVCVVGRRILTSSYKDVKNIGMYDFSDRKYRVSLLNVPFRKGVLFYVLYNLQLFFFLLFRNTDILIANDLDTIIPNYFAAKIKHKPLLFDSHEYFPEVPELVNRPAVKKVWETIEKIFVPKVSYCYTVCDSIARIYAEKYGKKFEVIRNLPFRKVIEVREDKDNDKLNSEKSIIYQGALNVGRGIELVIDAMEYLPDVHFYIAGSGDIESILKERARECSAFDRIHFLGRIPFENLHKYTCKAWVGISLEENMGLNYYYALPNKLFDYVQAGVPVLASDFPEMHNIVHSYNIGITTLERDPQIIASIINEMITNVEKRKIWKENLKRAADELCWENEKYKLIEIVGRAISQ